MIKFKNAYLPFEIVEKFSLSKFEFILLNENTIPKNAINAKRKKSQRINALFK